MTMMTVAELIAELSKMDPDKLIGLSEDVFYPVQRVQETEDVVELTAYIEMA